MKRYSLALALLVACAAGAQSPQREGQEAAPRPAPAQIPARGTVQFAFTPWDNAEAMIVDCIRQARRQILVQAFSFTSRALANALIAAKRRGVDVQVLADREQTFGGEASRIPELEQAGIAVMLEVRYQSAHNNCNLI